MHWPDIFFRAKPARRREQDLPTPHETPAEIAQHNSEIESEASLADSQQPLPVSKVALPPAPVHPLASDLGVVKDMAEADTLRELTRSGGIRLIKRDFSFPEGHPEDLAPTEDLARGVAPDAAMSSNEATPAAAASPPPDDLSVPPAPAEERKTVTSVRPSPAINLSGSREPAAGGVYPSAMTIFRRRTKIADVARIVLPPKREESPAVPSGPAGIPSPAVPPPTAVPASLESAAIVLPASFPVAVATRPERPVEASAAEAKRVEPIAPVPAPEASSPAAERVPPKSNKEEQKQEEKVLPFISEAPMPAEPKGTSLSDETKNKEDEGATAAGSESAAGSTESAAPDNALSVGDTREKREFVLSNGERILGHILSETPEAIYIDHSTLGVLTIPRAQIAQRPVEIILINGDRVVGDIIAETADSLFVRHASLGILTVPRSQRSTRVVEAILKDGDRILGEVLGETDNFIVIRSATLGTVAVPHNRVAMLNRRAEQVELKALPPPSLENKPGA